MTNAADVNAPAPPKDYKLFGGLVLIAMIFVLVLALRPIFSLRPRIIP